MKSNQSLTFETIIHGAIVCKTSLADWEKAKTLLTETFPNLKIVYQRAEIGPLRIEKGGVDKIDSYDLQ